MSEPELDIERLCYGGSGLGRIEGKACFIPFTAPNDRVRIRVLKEKKSYLEGELVELIQGSPCRVTPRCPIFGSCGGCHWQHLAYGEQLRQKQQIFADTLRRLGGVTGEILPVVGSKDEYGYRSRIQLKLTSHAGRLDIGFYRGGTHEVADALEGCPISHPVLNRMLAEFRVLLPELSDLALVPRLDLAMGDDGESIAILYLKAGGDPERLARQLAAERAAIPSVTGLYVDPGGGRLMQVFGVEELSYRLPAGFLPGAPELRIVYDKGGFSQVNFGQNRELIRTVWQWCEFSGGERVLDLYCGNGNITLPLARYVKEMVGVEGHPGSIAMGRENARRNGIDNVRFQAAAAHKAVRQLASQGERFDVVILDPPRNGAGETVVLLPGLEPERIVYVSCDPSTLARDLGSLRDLGYELVRCQPVDMFPQTFHLESVSLLRRLG